MKAIKMMMMAALTILSVAVFAQDSTAKKMKAPKHKMEKMKYSCPMHADVVSDKPGKCTKCAMDLTKSEKEKMKMKVMKTYVCPMHLDVTSDKPGKCSKCGMDMKEKEMKETAFACPMKCEGDKTYAKEGKCPKCGMDLKEVKKKAEKKDDHSGHQH